ncbi:YbhB/YbcL family Raf kinase inhibitor-like protein [Rhizobium sp. DKSPLA3]|uniref:YbhB/YbcL family Raf kinase inhibitor-like protein n=1 Tax=Rhizobium quercicola TaxID=2901226 RepID=A0A9X1NT16_9HYPH|nr:YbhB/YbcL family Raf kinase inhibitor-like protein [Rhizobium quercicola]MCD7108846.1 YbhB/YbcL family Raf kinase inhibitor-like protein [Rhizobium quercicola]
MSSAFINVRSILIGLTLLGSSAAQAEAQEFRVTSTSMSEGGRLSSAQIFKGFGCDGGNTSPQLSWSGAPAGTKSFAVTAYDPDAPTGSGWWHWNIVNIPVGETRLAASASGTEALPKGAVELKNDYGSVGFGGACPPSGVVHRYIFSVHALNVEALDLPKDASNALAGFMIGSTTIATARLTAVYNR